MPTVFWKAANWLGLVDDERYGYQPPEDDRSDVETDAGSDEADATREPASVTVLHTRQDAQPARAASSSRTEGSQSRLDIQPGHFRRSSVEIGAVYPLVIAARSYEDAEHIGETYRSGVPVMMNLTSMPTDQARRVLDFNTGLVFAMGGRLEKVAPRMFLLSPVGVEVSQAERDRVMAGLVRAA